MYKWHEPWKHSLICHQCILLCQWQSIIHRLYQFCIVQELWQFYIIKICSLNHGFLHASLYIHNYEENTPLGHSCFHRRQSDFTCTKEQITCQQRPHPLSADDTFPEANRSWSRHSLSTSQNSNLKLTVWLTVKEH